ncbi:MAG: hypothetical protein WC816_08885 [Sphingomonas sp.]|jgi:hypothetical protein
MATEAASQGGFNLIPVVVLLGAAVIAVPFFKRLGLGSVLGYLAAGLAIGPFGIGLLRSRRLRGHARWQFVQPDGFSARRLYLDNIRQRLRHCRAYRAQT